VSPSLVAHRVVLRPFQDDDAKLLFRMYQDEELARIVPQRIHADLAESRGLLARILDQHARGTSIGWVITKREDGEAIGTAGLVRIDRESARSDIAYGILRDEWGTGLAHDAVERVLRFAFDDVRLLRVSARVDALNVRSRRFALRLGFAEKRTFEEPFGDSIRTTHVFERAAPFVIRRVEAHDARRLRDVRLLALSSDALSFGSTHAHESAFDEREWERWARTHASGEDQATFLALHGEATLGLVAAARDTADPARFTLFSMWVAPAARRLGVARRLVETAVTWVASTHATHLRLWALYESLGFKDDERQQQLPHAPTVLELGMTKVLRAARG
jgi:ribosomal-protein-alanine N-acetyltransferase